MRAFVSAIALLASASAVAVLISVTGYATGETQGPDRAAGQTCEADGAACDGGEAVMVGEAIPATAGSRDVQGPPPSVVPVRAPDHPYPDHP